MLEVEVVLKVEDVYLPLVGDEEFVLVAVDSKRLAVQSFKFELAILIFDIKQANVLMLHDGSELLIESQVDAQQLLVEKRYENKRPVAADQVHLLGVEPFLMVRDAHKVEPVPTVRSIHHSLLDFELNWGLAQSLGALPHVLCQNLAPVVFHIDCPHLFAVDFKDVNFLTDLEISEVHWEVANYEAVPFAPCILHISYVQVGARMIERDLLVVRDIKVPWRVLNDREHVETVLSNNIDLEFELFGANLPVTCFPRVVKLLVCHDLEEVAWRAKLEFLDAQAVVVVLQVFFVDQENLGISLRIACGHEVEEAIEVGHWLFKMPDRAHFVAKLLGREALLCFVVLLEATLPAVGPVLLEKGAFVQHQVSEHKVSVTHPAHPLGGLNDPTKFFRLEEL